MTLRQTFAQDSKGRIRSVEEVLRGLACNCFCPECGGRMESKQGDVRRWHFAHTSGIECPGAAETAMHLAAKQLLLESSGLVLPAVNVQRTITLEDGRRGHGFASRPEGLLQYVAVESEKFMGNIRPDIAIKTVHGEILIEIAVTHFVDREKQEKLLALGLPTLEIALKIDHSKSQAWTWDDLRSVVIDAPHNKNWLLKLEEDRLIREAEEAAELDAQNQDLILPRITEPTQSRTPISPKCFQVGRDKVYLSEMPFGIIARASSFGDVTIDPVLRSKLRSLGGKWKPRYRNWVFPSSKLEAIRRSLLELAKHIEEEPHGQRHKRVLDEFYNSEQQHSFDKTIKNNPQHPLAIPKIATVGAELPTENTKQPAPEDELGLAKGINERIRVIPPEISSS